MSLDFIQSTIEHHWSVLSHGLISVLKEHSDEWIKLYIP